MKYYYPNLLNNQNETAKNDIAWAADITEIELSENKKYQIFLCLDIHTNKIIAKTSSQNVIITDAIIKALKRAIRRRLVDVPKIKTILHTDRGSQFSSEAYNKFVLEFKDFIDPSMSRENTPTDNAVAERFMRTFKTFKIDEKTIEQAIQEVIISKMSTQSKSSTCTSTINFYVK